jgi:hypothetical protein
MATANELMTSYLTRTAQVRRRYLWTDAFAVCNLLGLGDLDKAVQLVERVHAELAPSSAAADHPTQRGLRIGKPLPERGIDEPLDERLEWDRDGQYFHYLTKWMHALDQLARTTRDARYSLWSRELADVAFRSFVYYSQPRSAPRMYWKMSVDLSRPQVASMGHHDPLDGYITCLQLAETAQLLAVIGGPDVAKPAAVYRTMFEPHGLATGDPLGLGGLLVDAYRLYQLDRDAELRAAILDGARIGLSHFAEHGDLDRPASHRLAFRELGLAIGLSALRHLPVRELAQYVALGDEIRDFWNVDANRRSPTYLEHADINDVMLATSLEPDGFLRLRATAATLSARRRAGA